MRAVGRALPAAWAVVATVLVLVPGASASACEGADAPPSSTTPAATRAAVLCLLNVERRKHGRAALQESPALRGAAEDFAQLMVRERFFDHDSPGGSTLNTRVRRSGYTRGARDWAAGENIGYAYATEATPREMVTAWMGSSGHKRNILYPSFRHVGIGAARGTPEDDSADGATFVTDFGMRRR